MTIFWKEVHVLVAVLLNAEHQGQLRLVRLHHGNQQGGVRLEVFHRLVRDQFLLLVPLDGFHQVIPNLGEGNVDEDLTCAFRASCYSTRLSWADTPVNSWAVCLGQKVSSNAVRG